MQQLGNESMARWQCLLLPAEVGVVPLACGLLCSPTGHLVLQTSLIRVASPCPALPLPPLIQRQAPYPNLSSYPLLSCLL
jgi:hypothetical protein